MSCAWHGGKCLHVSTAHLLNTVTPEVGTSISPILWVRNGGFEWLWEHQEPIPGPTTAPTVLTTLLHQLAVFFQKWSGRLSGCSSWGPGFKYYCCFGATK